MQTEKGPLDWEVEVRTEDGTRTVAHVESREMAILLAHALTAEGQRVYFGKIEVEF